MNLVLVLLLIFTGVFNYNFYQYYIMITSSKQRWCYCTPLGNVAYHKPTAQTADWGGYTSDRAVDGITDDSCAASSGTDAWWRVDLGELHRIYSVTLYTQASEFVSLCTSTKAHWYQG